MKIFDYLDRALTFISIAALSLLTIMVTASVIGRYFFNQPIPDDVLLGEVLMLPIVYLPMAAVQARRSHIYVSLFTDGAPRRVRATLEVIGMILGALFFGALAHAGFSKLIASWESQAYLIGLLQFPEWPGRLALFLGCALFALRLALDAARAMLGLAPAGVLEADAASGSSAIE